MFKIANPRVFAALFLMATLLFGAVAAEARDTHGSDRLVKGAVAGAAVGALTQLLRGQTGGVQVLKGAAVGTAVGAAAGAYSDYKQEKDARYDHRGRDYDRYRYDARRNNYRVDDHRYAPRYRNGYDRNRGGARAYRQAHRHNVRCRH